MFAKIRIACWGPHAGPLAKFPLFSEVERAQRKRGSEAALKASILKRALNSEFYIVIILVY